MFLTGVMLAAGAGSRMGRPKALVSDERGAWLPRAVAVLRDGGCDEVLVVLGAAADEARALVPDGARVVVAEDWSAGMSASLRAGLAAVGPAADAALVSLVDLPDLVPAVVERVRAAAVGAGSLARASYDGEPGHPVLLGRDHWAAVLDVAHGDRGARDFLTSADVTLVECGDLAGGQDVDAR